MVDGPDPFPPSGMQVRLQKGEAGTIEGVSMNQQHWNPLFMVDGIGNILLFALLFGGDGPPSCEHQDSHNRMGSGLPEEPADPRSGEADRFLLLERKPGGSSKHGQGACQQKEKTDCESAIHCCVG